MQPAESKVWRVFYTRSRAEKRVENLLEEQDLEVFLPKRAEVRQWKGGTEIEKQDFLVTEEPLEIRFNDLTAAVTMRTPGQDEALAVGFLATERILHSPDDLYDVLRCGDPDDIHTGNQFAAGII